MSPEEEQRLFDARLNASAESCDKVSFAVTGDLDPAVEATPCDLPLAPSIEPFFPPSDPPPLLDINRSLPAPVVVEGAAFVATCAPGQVVQAGVNYAKGEVTAATQLVYLDSIPIIPTAELYRIADLMDGLVTLVNDDLANLVESNGAWDDFDAAIVTQLGVSTAIAQAIREALVAAQEKANDISRTVATADLRCAWTNRLLWAHCDLENTENPLGYLLTISPAAPPPGAVAASVGAATSDISQTDADAKAGRIAARELNCLFRNTVQTSTCAEIEEGAFIGAPTLLWPAGGSDSALRSPASVSLASLEGSYVVADTLPDVRTLKLTSTIAADQVTGRTQQEADDTAKLLATVGLDCFFPSRPRIFSCIDNEDYGSSFAHTEFLGGRSEDIILNEMATGATAGPRVDNAGIITSTIDTTVGVRTKLPAGMFVGQTSSEAEDLAEAFALSTLECLWGNVELTYACDDTASNTSVPAQVAAHRPSTTAFPLRPYTGATTTTKLGKSVFSSSLGQTLTMLASPRKSAPYEVSVIERQFLSADGQDAANEEAAAFAIAQLGCVYCNPRIAPVCALFVTSQPVGVDQLPPYTADNVEVLPVVAALLAPGQSADATAGVPGVRYSAATSWGPPTNYLTALTEGATFTCGDFDEVVAVVDVVGAIPIRDLVTATPDASCLYGNDRTAAACRTSTTRPDGVEVLNFHTPEEIEEYEDYLSARSSAGSIVVVEDTFQEAGTSGKATANLMAKAHALSQLNCYFESPKLELYCGASTAPLAGAGGAFPPVGVGFPSATAFTNPAAAATVYGDGKFGVVVGGEYVHPRSKGYKQSAVDTISPDAKPVRLSYGVGRSDASPTDALLQALFIGLGQLNCFFLNAAQPAACPNPVGTTFVTPPGSNPTALVAADLYPSVESQAAADDFAKLVAEASLVCLYTHPNSVTVSVCSPTTRILISPGVVPARFTVSPLSSAAALTDSTALAASFVVCDSPDSNVGAEFSSPFGAGAGAGATCCKVSLTPGSLSDLTSLTVCITDAADTPPQTNVIKAKAAALGDECAEAGYYYIQALVQRKTNGKSPDTEWWGEAINFTLGWQTGVAPSVISPTESGGVYTIRRVVAEIVSGETDDCSDTTILQAVNAPQKVTTTLDSEGNKIPIIVDLHSPGGGSATSVVQPLVLVTTRPSYIPAGVALAEGMKSIWVTWGFANERLPTNWHHRLDVPTTGDYTKYIYLKVNFATGSDALVVTTCAWETFSFPAVTPPWGANGARPSYFYILLGTVTSGGMLPAGVHIVNNGGGSIQVSEYLSRITQGGAEGFTYQKTFSIQRFLT